MLGSVKGIIASLHLIYKIILYHLTKEFFKPVRSIFVHIFLQQMHYENCLQYSNSCMYVCMDLCNCAYLVFFTFSLLPCPTLFIMRQHPPASEVFVQLLRQRLPFAYFQANVLIYKKRQRPTAVKCEQNKQKKGRKQNLL